MNKVAISFSTRDRVELSQQSITPLEPKGFDLFIVDGSNTAEGQKFAESIGLGDNVHYRRYGNVRGGADSAIVFSLTTLLNHLDQYEYVGLVENDVLLHPDWFAPTMQLFEQGRADGLEVGAVSARCYEDRILLQRDGFAVCHNLGAGCVIFTRPAAELVLQNFRTGWWAENRRTFVQLSGLDIGRYAAFRVNEQWVCADWHFDQVLAEFGFASLALTPSPVEMIGQVPDLHVQGLKLVTEPVEERRNDAAFKLFCQRTSERRYDRRYDRRHTTQMPNQTQWQQGDDGAWVIFPHQVNATGGKYAGDWRLKWSQGFGPFAWQAGDLLPDSTAEQALPTLTIPVSGACMFMVSGGIAGGQVHVRDTASGYECSPVLPPEGPTTQVLNLPVPGGVTYRDVVLTMLTPGTVFYGLATSEPQPWLAGARFDYSVLPPV